MIHTILGSFFYLVRAILLNTRKSFVGPLLPFPFVGGRTPSFVADKRNTQRNATQRAPKIATLQSRL